MRFTFVVFLLLSVATAGFASIKSDLNDFYNTLPKIRIGFIVTKHYLFDGDFNTGYSYLKSSTFKRLYKQEIETSPEFQKILDFVGYSIDLDFIQSNLRSLSIPIDVVENYPNERTFTSFVEEIADCVPQEKFRNLIRQKTSANGEFAELYRKVMDPEFRRLVYQARNSDSLAGPIKTLRQNKIDVDRMLTLALDLLDKLRQ